jgi:hypothetical protein
MGASSEDAAKASFVTVQNTKNKEQKKPLPEYTSRGLNSLASGLEPEASLTIK